MRLSEVVSIGREIPETGSDCGGGGLCHPVVISSMMMTVLRRRQFFNRTHLINKMTMFGENVHYSIAPTCTVHSFHF